VKIPTDIAPGNYVLRHEIIVLHAAGQINGAQDYSFCYNLAIDSEGTATPDGIAATEFYEASDPGIKFDLFSHLKTYIISGVSLSCSVVLVSLSSCAVTTANEEPALYTAAASV
jgi:lytic cellulose monooxygenase (C1-hydroxylating)